MVTTTELALLVLVLALLLGAYRIIKVVKPFIVNAVVGLLVLLGATYLGLGVAITPMAVLVCALGGVPGAILVIILAYLDIAFAASVAPLAGLAVA
ncbi:pro-sigmaK processing inhibitor BofA family protein [Natronomonas salina]|uniref:pro-sigmaK processing inhibitor BofA family protein n=1 Tax=Natronomonas salina TaxID=1710540 RepID=UPI0015B77E80|nr:pro-sigmaK processing inhibitor BofA family protein [Natronomonas salina]QLD90508.1 pro-sigmaK processing inhibitor BofA family protein [Natronomonas salina]